MDLQAVINRFNTHPLALRYACLHWLHHQAFASEALEVVREVVVNDSGEDARSFLTIRGALETNSANRDGSDWLSTVRFLAAADDWLRAGFSVWAGHNLTAAKDRLGRIEDVNDVFLPPTTSLLERLVESGSSAVIRRSVNKIIANFLSIAVLQVDHSVQHLGGIQARLLNTIFELSQLPKARWMNHCTDPEKQRNGR